MFLDILVKFYEFKFLDIMSRKLVFCIESIVKSVKLGRKTSLERKLKRRKIKKNEVIWNLDFHDLVTISPVSFVSFIGTAIMKCIKIKDNDSNIYVL